MRLIAAILAIALSGPSVASLICDWACASKHQAAPTSSAGCHGHATDAAVPSVAAGHACHGLNEAPHSILTTAPQLLAGILPVADVWFAEARVESSPVAGIDVRRRAHAPPHPLLPLRI